MSKKAKDRRVGAVEAMSKVRSLRTSARKLNLVAQSIRGLKVQRALNELEFSPKRIAKDVRKALYSAISNAENNHNLDIDSLIVAEAYIGKNLIMKRFSPRARGRTSRPDGSPGPGGRRSSTRGRAGSCARRPQPCRRYRQEPLRAGACRCSTRGRRRRTTHQCA